MSENKNEYRVEMEHICKSFEGVKALQDVSAAVRPGEIHALVGENGAGKSTLIRVLSGVYAADSGEVKLSGKPVHFADPKDGILAGISVIYQEFALVQHLSVAENILLDDFRNGSIVNWKACGKKQRSLGKIGSATSAYRRGGRAFSRLQQVVESASA
jgi:ABC-type sugar transport system ATPase subunit